MQIKSPWKYSVINYKHDASEESNQSNYYTEAKRLWKDAMTRHGREAKYWLEYAKWRGKFGERDRE